MAGMAVWILVSIAVDTPMSHHHLHSMGKLMFAFVCFWGYTAFCQFMLIWIADIPDETPWFHMRLYSDWRYVGYFLVVFHFALPFVILLSKELKFSKRKLGFMAVWMLVAHAVDVYWLVLPEITPSGSEVQSVGPLRLRRRRRPGRSASSSGACAAACSCRSAIPSSPLRWSTTRESADSGRRSDRDRQDRRRRVRVAGVFGVGVVWSVSIQRSENKSIVTADAPGRPRRGGRARGRHRLPVAVQHLAVRRG